MNLEHLNFIKYKPLLDLFFNKLISGICQSKLEIVSPPGLVSLLVLWVKVGYVCCYIVSKVGMERIGAPLRNN